jgi:hypothetical protein
MMKTKAASSIVLLWIVTCVWVGSATAAPESQNRHPNILFAFADDWSWPHASIAHAIGRARPQSGRAAVQELWGIHE